jgi:hypothetical protein
MNIRNMNIKSGLSQTWQVLLAWHTHLCDAVDNVLNSLMSPEPSQETEAQRQISTSSSQPPSREEIIKACKRLCSGGQGYIKGYLPNSRDGSVCYTACPTNVQVGNFPGGFIPRKYIDMFCGGTFDPNSASEYIANPKYQYFMDSLIEASFRAKTQGMIDGYVYRKENISTLGPDDRPRQNQTICVVQACMQNPLPKDVPLLYIQFFHGGHFAPERINEYLKDPRLEMCRKVLKEREAQHRAQQALIFSHAFKAVPLLLSGLLFLSLQCSTGPDREYGDTLRSPSTHNLIPAPPRPKLTCADEAAAMQAEMQRQVTAKEMWPAGCFFQIREVMHEAAAGGAARSHNVESGHHDFNGPITALLWSAIFFGPFLNAFLGDLRDKARSGPERSPEA